MSQMDRVEGPAHDANAFFSHRASSFEYSYYKRFSANNKEENAKGGRIVQSYLRKARFSTWIDNAGLRLLIMLLGLGWFVYLWGLSVPALLAGLALGALGQMGLSCYRRHTVGRREKALRSRLGAEMFLEEILLAPAKQAHFQTALLLGERYSLTMERVTADGMLCRSGEEQLLVSCIPLPENAEAGQGQIIAVQRACKAHGAIRGVACVTGRCSAKVEAMAAEGTIPVRIIRRETLLELAGQVSPATDEQLVELGKRKKRPAPMGIRRMILRRDKAKTYLIYGTGLMLMYVVTGLRYYPVPGAVCLLLAVLSKTWKGGEERL